MYQLERHQLIRRPRAEVFAFFSDAANLEKLTPPFLGFRILTPPPIEMRAGTRIDYKISLHGIPMTWQTLIERFEPDDLFVDRQLKGPYAHWHHTHTFTDAPGGTSMSDRVVYRLPFGPLGRLAHAAFVRRQLRTIFDHRERVMVELFG